MEAKKNNKAETPDFIETMKSAFKRYVLFTLVFFVVLEISWVFKVVYQASGCEYFETAFMLSAYGIFPLIPVVIGLTFFLSIFNRAQTLAKLWGAYAAFTFVVMFIVLTHSYVDSFAISRLTKRLEPLAKLVKENDQAMESQKKMDELLSELRKMPSIDSELKRFILTRIKSSVFEIDGKPKCTICLTLKLWSIDDEVHTLVLKINPQQSCITALERSRYERVKSESVVGSWLRGREVYRDTGFVQ